MTVRSVPWAWWSARRWARPSPHWISIWRRSAGPSWPRAGRAGRHGRGPAPHVRCGLSPGPGHLEPGHPRRRTAAAVPPGCRTAHPRRTPRGLAAAASPARDRSCRTRAGGCPVRDCALPVPELAGAQISIDFCRRLTVGSGQGHECPVPPCREAFREFETTHSAGAFRRPSQGRCRKGHQGRGKGAPQDGRADHRQCHQCRAKPTTPLPA